MSIRRRVMGLVSGSPTVAGPPEIIPEPVEPVQTKPSVADLDGPKLNIGSGWDMREGWINIDMHARHNPDIVADGTRLTPIADGYAVYALAQDILEHIHRNRCMTALKEWNRVLRIGGLLEIRTTDVIAVTDLMRDPERSNPEAHNLLLQCMFGTQGYEGDFHLSGFTEIWMRDAMEKAGFEVVYFGHKDIWLMEVIGRKVSDCRPDSLITMDGDNAFLDAAYRRFLNREPDPSGREYWLAQLHAGIPRELVMAALEAAEH